jgi:hypothetical protein
MIQVFGELFQAHSIRLELVFRPKREPDAQTIVQEYQTIGIPDSPLSFHVSKRSGQMQRTVDRSWLPGAKRKGDGNEK